MVVSFVADVEFWERKIYVLARTAAGDRKNKRAAGVMPAALGVCLKQPMSGARPSAGLDKAVKVPIAAGANGKACGKSIHHT